MHFANPLPPGTGGGRAVAAFHVLVARFTMVTYKYRHDWLGWCAPVSCPGLEVRARVVPVQWQAWATMLDKATAGACAQVQS